MSPVTTLNYVVVTTPPEVLPWSSAGVYNSSGELVRTLWSYERDDERVSNPAAAWDGLVEDGSIAPTGAYTVKVLRHNISYAWEGVLGNTSPDHTDITYHNYASGIGDMEITPSGEVYFLHGYDERYNDEHVLHADDIQKADYILAIRSPKNDPVAVTTDGNATYFARFENPDFSTGYVWAVDCADALTNPPNPGVKLVKTFTFGVPKVGGSLSGIGDTTTGQFIMDIAVQWDPGTFLFISRFEVASPPPYAIWTLDKDTGEILQHNSGIATFSGAIACDPVTGALWVAHGSGGSVRDRVTKYVADGAGVLSATAIIISGFTSVLNLAVSHDGATLYVSDGGASQTVKAFNTSDGSVKVRSEERRVGKEGRGG